jgi:hypothetical protein
VRRGNERDQPPSKLRLKLVYFHARFVRGQALPASTTTMAREYSVRFVTERHDDRVPFDVYAQSLEQLAQALASTRNMLAHKIAQSTGRKVGAIKQALQINARTPVQGSNCVPLELGDPKNVLDLDVDIAALFWDGTSAELHKIGNSSGAAHGADLPLTAAEHFANAGAIADTAKVQLQLAYRTDAQSKRWTSSSNLTELVEPLRVYSKRLRELHRRDAQIMGKIIALSFDPLQAQIETSTGRVWVRFSREQKDAFVSRAEHYVMIDVEAEMSDAGAMVHPVATDIASLVVSRNLADDFRTSRGGAGEQWRQRADEFFDDIRQK